MYSIDLHGTLFTFVRNWQ